MSGGAQIVRYPSDGFDLNNVAIQANPYPAYTWLRDKAPVYKLDGVPMWVVSRHADILEVERQNDLFHNGDRATIVTPIDLDQKVRMVMGLSLIHI